MHLTPQAQTTKISTSHITFIPPPWFKNGTGFDVQSKQVKGDRAINRLSINKLSLWVLTSSWKPLARRAKLPRRSARYVKIAFFSFSLSPLCSSPERPRRSAPTPWAKYTSGQQKKRGTFSPLFLIQYYQRSGSAAENCCIFFAGGRSKTAGPIPPRLPRLNAALLAAVDAPIAVATSKRKKKEMASASDPSRDNVCQQAHLSERLLRRKRGMRNSGAGDEIN